MIALRICLLGPPQILRFEKPVTHRLSQKALGLLAYLVMGPSHGYTRENLAGLQVNLYELPEFERNLDPIQERGGIEISGVVRQGFARLNRMTTDIAGAVEDVEYILVATQALAHERLAELCAPFAHEGQAIILFPGSGGALVFGKTLPVAIRNALVGFRGRE
jgi:hypothetical protein